MTEQLKTLKDVQESLAKGEEKEIDLNAWEFSDVLRVEAIKWYKELTSVQVRTWSLKAGPSYSGKKYSYCPRCEIGFDIVHEVCFDCRHKADWIKMFFGLSEEDIGKN